MGRESGRGSEFLRLEVLKKSQEILKLVEISVKSS